MFCVSENQGHFNQLQYDEEFLGVVRFSIKDDLNALLEKIVEFLNKVRRELHEKDSEYPLQLTERSNIQLYFGKNNKAVTELDKFQQFVGAGDIY